jgi:hypothetical protein
MPFHGPDLDVLKHVALPLAARSLYTVTFTAGK